MWFSSAITANNWLSSCTHVRWCFIVFIDHQSLLLGHEWQQCPQALLQLTVKSTQVSLIYIAQHEKSQGVFHNLFNIQHHLSLDPRLAGNWEENWRNLRESNREGIPLTEWTDMQKISRWCLYRTKQDSTITVIWMTQL